MVRIGRSTSLRVKHLATPGAFLDGGELGDILLPGRYVPHGTLPGEAILVFVHLDSEDRVVATTETPHVQAGEFATLRVVSFNARIGAFLDWGLSKDLLLPMREMTGRVNVGDWIVVHVFVDEKSGRIIASMRISRHFSRSRPRYEEGQPVDLLVYGESDLGFKCIVENAHDGLLYRNELASAPVYGQKLTGFIKTLREDGKLDLRLDRGGYQRIAPLSEKILAELTARGGRLLYSDKTPPEEIRETFGASKKAFKQAIGALFKERQIVIEEHGIRLPNTPLIVKPDASAPKKKIAAPK